MDRFCTSTTKKGDDIIKPVIENPTKSVSFDITKLDADIRILYEKLTEIEQHGFRIAFEHLGSSFDYRQCI